MAFTRLSPKGLRLGQEVVEIQLTNLRGSPFADAEGLVDSNTFCSSELYRQVGLGYIELWWLWGVGNGRMSATI